MRLIGGLDEADLRRLSGRAADAVGPVGHHLLGGGDGLSVAHDGEGERSLHVARNAQEEERLLLGVLRYFRRAQDGFAYLLASGVSHQSVALFQRYVHGLGHEAHRGAEEHRGSVRLRLAQVDEGLARLIEGIGEAHRVGLLAIELIALAGLHVAQVAEPLSAALAVGGEHGKLRLALHHVA